MAISILAHPCAIPNARMGDLPRVPRQQYQRYDLTVEGEAIHDRGAARITEQELRSAPSDLATDFASKEVN